MEVKRNLVLLDFVRGSAALIVVAGHLADLMFLASRPDSSAWYKAFQLVTSQGHAAVLVFFVMSGFLVGKHVRDAFNSGAWSWRDYAIRRLTRLWIVLIPALALTAFFDQMGIHLFDGSVYSGLRSGPLFAWSLPDSIESTQRFDFSTLIGNLFFLQTISFPLFGTDGPLWSLCNEFWYYVLFPLLYVLFKQEQSRRAKVVSAVFVAILAMYLPGKIIAYGLIWLFGFFVVVADDWFDHRPINVPSWAIWGGAIGFAGVLYVFSRLVHAPEFLRDVITGASFSLLLFFLLKVVIRNDYIRRLSGGLAAISYSLYLTHFPFFVFMTVAINDTKKVDHDLSGFLVYACLFCAALILASGFYWAFEKHTARVQSGLISRRRRPSVRSVAPASSKSLT